LPSGRIISATVFLLEWIKLSMEIDMIWSIPNMIIYVGAQSFRDKSPRISEQKTCRVAGRKWKK
jgi:hypothetical protein